MRIGFARRLEKLEDQTRLSDVRHLITVTYVDADGKTSGGYRIEGSFASGEWSRISLVNDEE